MIVVGVDPSSRKLAFVTTEDDELTLALITSGPFKDMYVTYLPNWGTDGFIDISTADFNNAEELKEIAKYPNNLIWYPLRRYLSDKTNFCKTPGVKCF